jgi:hypothetical protein
MFEELPFIQTFIDSPFQLLRTVDSAGLSSSGLCNIINFDYILPGTALYMNSSFFAVCHFYMILVFCLKVKLIRPLFNR